MSQTLLISFAIGPWQVALIIGAMLLLFGGKKIPELMKGIGNGIKEFKNATKGEDESTSTKEKEKN